LSISTKIWGVVLDRGNKKVGGSWIERRSRKPCSIVSNGHIRRRAVGWEKQHIQALEQGNQHTSVKKKKKNTQGSDGNRYMDATIGGRGSEEKNTLLGGEPFFRWGQQGARTMSHCQCRARQTAGNLRGIQKGLLFKSLRRGLVRRKWGVQDDGACKRDPYF